MKSAQFAAKPAARTPDIVEQFISVIINDIKKNCLKLPTLPEIAVKVQQAVKDKNTSAAQISKIIGIDAAVCARLFRVTNSPMYRSAKPVEDIQQAITRLGYNVVRNLVTSFVLQQLFQSPSHALKDRMKALWMHSTEVAVISSTLARKFTKLQPDQAMLAGLLHDIGTLPILSRSDDFPEISGNPEALELAIETMHTKVGKLLLTTWKFSPILVAVAAEHEDWDRYTSEVDYVDIVLVANLHSHIGGKHRHAHTNWADVPAFAKLGLTPAESLAAMEEVKVEMTELHQLLDAAR